MLKNWELEVSNKGKVRFKKRGIVCETSAADLSIAGVRYPHVFSRDFEMGATYDLLNFPPPSSDRVEIHIEVSIGEVRYSVGRWRDAQGVNAYFMWGGGAPNDFIPTADKKGRIRCRRVGEVLFGEFFDGNQWVTIGKREVNSQEARISFKAFNSTSKKKVSVIFNDFHGLPGLSLIAPSEKNGLYSFFRNIRTKQESSTLGKCNLCTGDRFQKLCNVEARYGLGRVKIIKCLNCGLAFLACDYESVKGAIKSDGDVRKMVAGFLTRSDINIDTEKDLFIEYNKHRESAFKRYADLILERKNKGKILDIGCGNGFFLTLFDDHWDKWGVEYNEINYKECLKNGSRNIFFGEFKDFPFGEKFDAATMLEYIEHSEDPLYDLKKTYELLNYGGILVVETGNLNSKEAKEKGPDWAYFTAAPDHKFFFSNKTLFEMLRKIGFQEISFCGAEDSEVMAVVARKG